MACSRFLFGCFCTWGCSRGVLDNFADDWWRQRAKKGSDDKFGAWKNDQIHFVFVRNAGGILSYSGCRMKIKM